MIVSISGADIAIRTPFSETQDLTQVLRGIRKTHSGRNEPVDFRLAGLVRKNYPDIWHVDQVLAFSTDECSPFVINGEDIGGNHGHPCGMAVQAEHSCTCRDIGTRYLDEAGMGWTLLRVEGNGQLLFLAEDISCRAIAGAMLRPEDGERIVPEMQQAGRQLTPAIRHIRCDVEARAGGAWRRCDESCEDAQQCRITEVYEVMDPRCVAETLRNQRPAEGYPVQPDIAVGRAMAVHRMVYTIQGDGTVLCEFDHEACKDTPITLYLGIMAQEKCDVFGGGVHRIIPGIRIFEDKGCEYDFSRSYNITAGPMPDVHPVMRGGWLDPDNPPDRQIDVLRRADGTDAVAFACGFLPLHDGAPEIRRQNVEEAWTIVRSCKTYPTFAGSMAWSAPEGATCLRGAAYKKYYLPEGGLDYDICCDGETYHYTV